MGSYIHKQIQFTKGALFLHSRIWNYKITSQNHRPCYHIQFRLRNNYIGSYIVDNKELSKQSNGFYGFFSYSGNFQQILIGTGDRKYVSQQI